MFLIDDILMAPVRGLFWIFKEIHHAAEEEQANEAEAITTKLSELYMMLETGQMTEAEFDAAEKALLDRLDAIKERADGGPDKEDEEDEEVVIRKRPPKRQAKLRSETS
jgi:hypothetical protein